MSRYLVMKSACARPKYRVMKRACAGSNSREKAYAGPGLIQEAQNHIQWGTDHRGPQVWYFIIGPYKETGLLGRPAGLRKRRVRGPLGPGPLPDDAGRF